LLDLPFSCVNGKYGNPERVALVIMTLRLAQRYRIVIVVSGTRTIPRMHLGCSVGAFD
jgi:hypothetical protein